MFQVLILLRNEQIQNKMSLLLHYFFGIHVCCRYFVNIFVYAYVHICICQEDNQDSFIVVNVVYGNFAIFIEKPLTEQSEISEPCLIGYFYIFYKINQILLFGLIYLN